MVMKRNKVTLALCLVALLVFAGAFNYKPDQKQQKEKDVQDFEVYTESIDGTDVNFKMVPIQEGEFMIGSPEDQASREADEGPQKNVKLEAFYMMETELTWDLYELFIDKDKSATLAYSSDELKVVADAVTRPSTPYLDPSFGMGKRNYPAISMTQYSALVFCKWLSQVTGKFYRLPTEAEWEYACKAGTSTAYSFGDNVDELTDYGWYWDNSDDKYHEVAQKKPNPWGLYDMHGNVAEWTMDQYQEDFYATIEDGATNPWRIPDNLYPRSVRGGSWDDDPEALRSAARVRSSKD